MENAQQESMLVGGLFLSLLVTWGSTEISQLPHFQSSILLLSLVLFCFVCMLMARLSTTVLYVATRGCSIVAIFSRNIQRESYCYIYSRLVVLQEFSDH